MVKIDDILDYCVNIWLKTGVWPTVRETAVKFKVRQYQIVDLIEADPDSCLEYWYTKHKIGDEFIYVINHRLLDVYDSLSKN